jgi:hypothetical protein
MPSPGQSALCGPVHQMRRRQAAPFSRGRARRSTPVHANDASRTIVDPCVIATSEPSHREVKHYHWARARFSDLIATGGQVEISEARLNKIAHAGRILQFFGNERCSTTSAVMTISGAACYICSGDELPDTDEDACFSAAFNQKHLAQPPVHLQRRRQPGEPRTGCSPRRSPCGRGIFRWWHGAVDA